MTGPTRRSLFQLLTAGLVFDPERLLWVPGAKLISVPAERKWVTAYLWLSNPKVGDVLNVPNWGTNAEVIAKSGEQLGGAVQLMRTRKSATQTACYTAQGTWQEFVDASARRERAEARLERRKDLTCSSKNCSKLMTTNT